MKRITELAIFVGFAAVAAAGLVAFGPVAAAPSSPTAGIAAPVARARVQPPFDPIALASASIRQVKNAEAPIPAQCYTKTEGLHNPCWTCHTTPRFPNFADDWELQKEYAFSDIAKTNHWQNLFADRRAEAAALSEAQVLSYIREDNYVPLKQALAGRNDYPGYRPDLDFVLGFDEQGFARDGSGWRALRFKPFPGAFWPTNGSTDDVMVRLPEKFRSKDGAPNLEVYRANLAILEASFTSNPSIVDKQLHWLHERLDERALGADLDGNGALSVVTRATRGLPRNYLGDAREVRVRRALYPAGTEFLHSVRYVDPDATHLIATRMKELRYSRKTREVDDWAINRAYENELNEKDEGRLPVFAGSPLVGLHNDFGWMLQGFIEDGAGRLRVQTHEEHLACMGCHTNLGVTLDQTFSFARKVPGADGWRYQDLRGMPDAPQLGHADPEVLTYLMRAGGSDEFRENQETRQRFPTTTEADQQLLRRSAPGGDRGLAELITPSRARALDLNRAYMALVREQRFDLGRDAMLAPAQNVHQSIHVESSGLEENRRVYTDGQLRLDWQPRRGELSMR